MKLPNQVFSLFLFVVAAQQISQAQIQNVWVGGFPGRPIDWNVAANWSLQRVPDIHHDVLIPNTASTTFSYPVIDDAVEIHQIRIESGAKLVILENGYLHLNCSCSSIGEALANQGGVVENRSKNLIGFEPSVFSPHNSNLYTAKKD